METKKGQIVQITKRKCSDKQQPEIKFVNKYFVEGTDKLKDGTLIPIDEFNDASNTLRRLCENWILKNM